MRGATFCALGATLMLVSACASPDTAGSDAAGPDSRPMANDCAIIAAVAKEHHGFGPDNAPPPLRGGGDASWKPSCDFSALGFRFADHAPPAPGSDPRQTLRWVSFQKPSHDGRGALVLTEIMHGPLAGMGYECRLHSGFAGWTVGECKVSWVS